MFDASPTRLRASPALTMGVLTMGALTMGVLTMGVLTMGLIPLARAQGPASRGSSWNCLVGTVTDIGVFGSGPSVLLEFTIDPGSRGKKTPFQGGPVAPEVFASWSTLLALAYSKQEAVAVQYGNPIAGSVPQIVQVAIGRGATGGCSVNPGSTPRMSAQPAPR